MSSYNAPFEIHVHGQVQLRADASFEQLQDALKPLWKYAGARSLADGATSAYEEEPGIKFDPKEHLLQICWTVRGDEDFRQTLDEMCMNLNELASTGAPIEVTFYDAEFDDDEDGSRDEDDSRDDFMVVFVGPNCADCAAAVADARSVAAAQVEVLDISGSATAREAFALTRATGLPATMAGTQILVGRQPTMLQSMVGAAGMGQSNPVAN